MKRVAVDAIIEKDDKILLVKRGNEPCKGEYAFPGGAVEENETVEQAVVREAKEETNLDVKPTDIVGVYSGLGRDPRGYAIATVFKCEIIGGKEAAGTDASEVKWFDLNKVPELAFDHHKIIVDYKKWKQNKQTHWSVNNHESKTSDMT